jgi:hypothetical protein
MKRYCQSGLLLTWLLTVAAAQDDLPGTARVTPRIDVELQPVPVLVPEHFDHLPAGLSLNLPPRASAGPTALPSLTATSTSATVPRSCVCAPWCFYDKFESGFSRKLLLDSPMLKGVYFL